MVPTKTNGFIKTTMNFFLFYFKHVFLSIKFCILKLQKSITSNKRKHHLNFYLEHSISNFNILYVNCLKWFNICLLILTFSCSYNFSGRAVLITCHILNSNLNIKDMKITTIIHISVVVYNICRYVGVDFRYFSYLNSSVLLNVSQNFMLNADE